MFAPNRIQPAREAGHSSINDLVRAESHSTISLRCGCRPLNGLEINAPRGLYIQFPASFLFSNHFDPRHGLFFFLFSTGAFTQFEIEHVRAMVMPGHV